MGRPHDMGEGAAPSQSPARAPCRPHPPSLPSLPGGRAPARRSGPLARRACERRDLPPAGGGGRAGRYGGPGPRLVWSRPEGEGMWGDEGAGMWGDESGEGRARAECRGVNGESWAGAAMGVRCSDTKYSSLPPPPPPPGPPPPPIRPAAAAGRRAKPRTTCARRTGLMATLGDVVLGT